MLTKCIYSLGAGALFFLVIMVWELCFMPWMSWDVWLHHITVIAGVVISTDPHLSALLSGYPILRTCGMRLRARTPLDVD